MNRRKPTYYRYPAHPTGTHYSNTRAFTGIVFLLFVVAGVFQLLRDLELDPTPPMPHQRP